MLKCLRNLNFIQGFRGIVQYSTSASTDGTPALVNYFVDSLGFSKQQALSTSANLSDYRRRCGVKVSDFKFSGNADLVIEFLKQNGFTQSEIRNIVSSGPKILLANVEKTLKPKFVILEELGLSRSDIAQLISVNPLLLFQRFNPGIQALREVLGCDEDVIRIIKRLRTICFYRTGKYLMHNIGLLESYGIPKEKIKKGILRYPFPFVLRTELFSDIMIKVEEKLGIPRDSAMFLYGIQLLGGRSKETINAKCQIFKSFGWTEHDILAIVRQNPYCLTSSEERIKKSLEFLMNELGYKPAYLASCSCLLTYSLEKRLMPRHRALQVLKERGLVREDYHFRNAVVLSESKFLERFVERYKDEVPDLHHVYIKSRL